MNHSAYRMRKDTVFRFLTQSDINNNPNVIQIFDVRDAYNSKFLCEVKVGENELALKRELPHGVLIIGTNLDNVITEEYPDGMISVTLRFKREDFDSHGNRMSIKDYIREV